MWVTIKPMDHADLIDVRENSHAGAGALFVHNQVAHGVGCYFVRIALSQGCNHIPNPALITRWAVGGIQSFHQFEEFHV